MWRRSGLGSFRQWVKEKPEQALLFRRLVLTADCWIRSKHDEINVLPWRLAQLCDSRVDDASKDALAESFAQKEACCLDAYFSRRLTERRQITTRSDVLDPEVLAALHGWCQSISPVLTCASVENRHARNRRLASGNGCNNGGGLTVPSFCAKAVLAESKTHLKVRSAVDALMLEPPSASLSETMHKTVMSSDRIIASPPAQDSLQPVVKDAMC